MKKFYYMVPRCKECGSYKTGRYVVPPRFHKEYMMIESLKNGEIIQFRAKEPLKNAFCLNCGHEWIQKVEISRLSAEEKEEQIIRRGTEEMLNDYIERNHLNDKKKSIFGGIFSGLTKF